MKKRKKRRDTHGQLGFVDRATGKKMNGRVGDFASEADPGSERGDEDDGGCEEGSHKQLAGAMDDRMTPAERRFHEQKAKLDS